MTQANVTESEDGHYVVRFQNGVGLPVEYRCASAAEAKNLIDSLGLKRAPRRPSGPGDDGAYRVRFADRARAQLASLSQRDWSGLCKAIAQRAIDAATVEPPSRAMLLAAGIRTAMLRVLCGSHVVIYESDAGERTLTVEDVIDIG
jgi:hypothetical protein